MNEELLVEVRIWDQTVGYVVWQPHKGVASFEYVTEFLNKQLPVAPIQMPLQEGVFEFPSHARSDTFKGMPGLLADALPDRFGNELLDAYLLRTGRKLESILPTERLLYMGARGMGALEFEPAKAQSLSAAERLDMDELVHLAGVVLQQRQHLHSSLAETSGLEQIIQVGTSAGGARAKAVIAWNPDTQDVVSGQALAPEGYSHWLLKFDGVNDQYLSTSEGFGRIEYAYHRMALAAGIEMMECRLLEEQGRAHFMTRRFDRVEAQQKLHVQTLCALEHFDYNFPGAHSYEQAFATARKLSLTVHEMEQLFRRAAFNMVARNQDDHTKNIAFVMDSQGQWFLAPAYDMTFAYRADSRWVSQHQMSVNGKRDQFERADLLALADAGDIRKPNEIIEQIQEVVAEWPRFAKDAGVDDIRIKAIQACFRQL
ncbi:type II toxin-antitoxin system HipA family toxin [Pleionea sp. CnH1-48]|uniref:type II toxin-antitoxin system HipA family toxin n=1 Tax=Pleionea sp. CnH1-48 TaxID=2954494 RepID=UPI002097DDBD|nr:type II toxin-antitoxin system HipA family toxin [Pleionea sp. CnH1-48]MCO7223113.1 type II toxin-antitoxin system HipA family toxin [Pleionea sp. CnH1-48]